LLANEFIDNWSAMTARRVQQIITIAPTATAQQLQEFAKCVENILQNDDEVLKASYFCALSNFAPTSFQITVQYFTITTDMLSHMRTRHRINCAILEVTQAFAVSISITLENRHNVIMKNEEGSPVS
jgi:small-conductance mechanosensitive channel